jgi:hypothetical protein
MQAFCLNTLALIDLSLFASSTVAATRKFNRKDISGRTFASAYGNTLL